MINRIGVRLTQGVSLAKEQEQWIEWFHWMKESGFGVVDLQEITEETMVALNRAELSLGSFDAHSVPQLFSKDAAKRNESAGSLKAQLSQAAALGVKACFMVLKPEDNTMPLQESFSMFRDVFPSITEEAERVGIRIVLEGWPGPAPYYPVLGCTPEMLRAMFEAVPSPALCVNYDPSHLVRLGIDHIRFLREFAGRIGHVHAKDCTFIEENVYLYGRNQHSVLTQPVKFSEGPWRYTIPGEGEVSWSTIAFELEQAGYRGPVCIELEDHRYSGSVEAHRAGLTKAMHHLQLYF